MNINRLNSGEFVSTREAADRLGVAVRTVQLWVESGVLQAWKTAGGHRRIRLDSIEAVLQSRERALAGSPDSHPAVHAPAPDRFRLLVVEDDSALRMLFEMTIGSWGLPISVELAENGFDALLKIGEHVPDLLITDLNMPGMDGFSMIRHLRQRPRWARMPLIVVTALGPGEIDARGGLPPDVPRFGKPVPFEQIEALVRQRLPSSPASARQQP